MQYDDPAFACRQAITLALRALASAPIAVASSEVALIEAQADLGAWGTWRVTFKQRRLIPTGPEDRIGAGGEVFVTVDLDAGTAVVR